MNNWKFVQKVVHNLFRPTIPVTVGGRGQLSYSYNPPPPIFFLECRKSKKGTGQNFGSS